MKKLAIVLMALTAFILTGCQSAQERKLLENSCIEHGHRYATTNPVYNLVSCADLNETTYTITTYDPISNHPRSIGMLDDYFNVVPMGKARQW